MNQPRSDRENITSSAGSLNPKHAMQDNYVLERLWNASTVGGGAPDAP